jgi:hypothetical protein
MIAFIQDHGMDVEMFTNGSGITADYLASDPMCWRNCRNQP